MQNKDKRRVILVSNMYPSKHSPAHGTFVKNSAQQLIANGFELKKVVINRLYRSKFAKLAAYLSFIARGVWVLLTSRSSDIVYVHFASFSGIPVILASAFKKLTVITNVHGGDVLDCPSLAKSTTLLTRFLSLKTLKRSHTVIVPSHFARQWMIEHFEIDSNRLFVSPSRGIELDLFKPDGNQKRGADKPVFGYVGRLDPGKGLPCLLDAFAQLLRQHGEAELHIVGSGKLKTDLNRQVSRLNMTTNVHFHGVFEQQQLPPLYNQFDYLVFPTELTETLGLVGLESMATGVPVIAPFEAGITAYLCHNSNGLSFVAADEHSLCQALVKAVDMPAQNYQSLCAGALKTAARYDSKKVGQALGELFRALP
ncbi:MAG: glycosyltransferase family 4 protein [Algicola sp.]|nr:glycosyltransferase family 4 protein [Algicola sp.]